MAVWVAEAANPQPWESAAFSPIVYDSGNWVVYVGGDGIPKFYKYNLDTNTWTELSDAPGNLYSALSMSPDGTKLVGAVWAGDRLFIYNISSPGWTTSAVAPDMTGGYAPEIQSTVWADDDTIWCQVRAHDGSVWRVKFYKYTVSTDTWTQYTNYATAATSNSVCLCISTDGTKLYAGQCGASYRGTTRYIIATDTIGAGPTLPSAYYFMKSADRHKLWYGPDRAAPASHKTITRWVNPDTEVLEPGVFPEYDPATSGMGAAVYGMTMCFVSYMLVEPKNLSITLAVLATVTTDEASSIEQEEATLNGTLDADGGETCVCGFEWGETDAYGNTTPTQSRTTGQLFAQTITGLGLGKTYHFRAFATNPAGTSYGSDETFTVPFEIPTVTTDPVTAVGQTSATLNGELADDGGEACDCGFEYGETTDYGTETPTESKTSGETFSQPITGLAPNKTYHFRAIATNSAGTGNGADRSLTTNPALVINRAYALAREEL